MEWPCASTANRVPVTTTSPASVPHPKRRTVAMRDREVRATGEEHGARRGVARDTERAAGSEPNDRAVKQRDSRQVGRSGRQCLRRVCRIPGTSAHYAQPDESQDERGGRKAGRTVSTGANAVGQPACAARSRAR